MQLKENKSIQFIWDEKERFYGIGFKTTDFKTIEELKKIKLHFIKYHGLWSLSNDVEISNNFHVVRFENMPKKLLESIFDSVEEKVEKENFSEIKALKYIINLFQKMVFKKEFKEILIGDIGEAIFMIKAKEIGLNADEKIRNSDNNLYDFVFDKFFVEVKSSSKNLNEITVDLRQIQESNKKKFVVSKFQLLENQLTICDLYKRLNSTNSLVLEKAKEYESLMNNDNDFKKIMSECTIIFDKVECFILEDSIIPKIQVVHEGGLKNIKCQIGITNCKKISLEELKNT